MNDKKKSILHIVHRAKFTDGYIGFMTICMTDYDHRFIVTYGNNPIKSADQDNVYVLAHNEDLTEQPQFQEMMCEADQIIVTGVFQRSAILRIPGSVLDKTWFHFWGGDFYCYREKTSGLRDALQRRAMFHCFKKAAGLIFLIDGEAKAFSEITGIQMNKAYVAPMEGDPRESHAEMFRIVRNRKNDSDTVQILLGNSATKENQHIEALDVLQQFAQERMRIICPLSYGDAEYAKKIAEYGKRQFGNKFVPLMDYLSYEQYLDILASCDIGVFNNDRQQGMGNIFVLLAMGKKVFLRQDTSMWNNYCRKGYHLFPVSEIDMFSWDDFINYSTEDKTNNIEVFDREDHYIQAAKEWEKVFLAMK